LSGRAKQQHQGRHETRKGGQVFHGNQARKKRKTNPAQFGQSCLPEWNGKSKMKLKAVAA
jgi:hypothetical protein